MGLACVGKQVGELAAPLLVSLSRRTGVRRGHNREVGADHAQDSFERALRETAGNPGPIAPARVAAKVLTTTLWADADALPPRLRAGPAAVTTSARPTAPMAWMIETLGKSRMLHSS